MVVLNSGLSEEERARLAVETAMLLRCRNDLRAFEAALRSSAAPAEQRLQALAILGRFAENAMLHNTPDGEEK